MRRRSIFAITMAMTMKRFVKETFFAEARQGVGQAFSDVEFERCTFRSCAFGMNLALPDGRAVARRIRVDRCKAVGMCFVGASILEDVDIHALQTAPMFVFGAAFRHVRFTGACGSFILAPVARTTDPHDIAVRAAYEEANAQFYETVDWALDISDAEFETMEIRGAIPADLIRRDPETQMKVRLSVVRETEPVWRKLHLAGTPWPLDFEMMMAEGHESLVLVAPKRHKTYFKPWLAGLQLLRREGIVDPE